MPVNATLSNASLELYLKRTGNNWKPSYAKQNTSFNKVIAGWRAAYKNASRANNRVRKQQVVKNFASNYNEWVTKLLAVRHAQMANEAAFVNVKTRFAAQHGNKKRTGVKLPNWSSNKLKAYQNSMAVNKNAVRRQLATILNRKAALEATRNNLERKIAALMNNYRELHQTHGWLYNN